MRGKGSPPTFGEQILRTCNRRALILMAPTHKGSPTRALEVMLNMMPLHIKAQELSLAAHDRVTLSVKDSWKPNRRGGTGHLQAWKSKKSPDHETDLTTGDCWRDKTWISTEPASREEMGRTQVYTDGSLSGGENRIRSKHLAKRPRDLFAIRTPVRWIHGLPGRAQSHRRGHSITRNPAHQRKGQHAHRQPLSRRETVWSVAQK